jgi:hypothetical protein
LKNWLQQKWLLLLFAALQSICTLSQFAKKSTAACAHLPAAFDRPSKHKKMSVENIINCPFKTKKAEM